MKKIAVGPYKGYHGRAEFDADEDEYHGVVTDITDVITFVGSSPEEVETEFRASVEDYLELCNSRGEAPDKPVTTP